MMDQHSLCCGAILLLFFASTVVSSHIANANHTSESTIESTASITPLMNRPKFVFNPILSTGQHFSCGFYCDGNDTETACLLAVVIHSRSFRNTSEISEPRVVWSANRNHPVKQNATLQLTRDGDLVLADADGTFVWSTNTSGKSVSGLNLTKHGNLVLFDGNNGTVWRSFDHPTDSLLVGQTLVRGRKLIANISPSNCSQGLHSLLFTRSHMRAYIETNIPTTYFSHGIRGEGYLKYENGSFNFFTIPFVQVPQFMRLESDGHLRVYEFNGYLWKVVVDLLTKTIGECGYPMACGKYGICSKGGCGGCPGEANGKGANFRHRNFRQPNLGCSPVTPISCDQSQYHTFLELQGTSYFGFNPLDNDYYYGNYTPLDLKIKVEDCKKSCLNNCSCKAVLSLVEAYYSKPYCLLLFEAFSFVVDPDSGNRSTVFLEVQKPWIPSESKSWYNIITLGSSLVAWFGVFPWVIYRIFIFLNKKHSEEDVEISLVQVSGLPTRFSYEDLKSMTNNFSNKLGEGGFGSVFLGTSIDGGKIAVKRLNGLGQIKKSFLAKVQTIGSIHHVNLVRLIGFCAENSNRLLVYEYMSNGSLDRWRRQDLPLGWESRRKVIADIAKGLAYLHEECRQKIYHLDIKPQNILLDENFEAKVSDFGLAKLIDKDQSKVVATLRGTPGYMAPEWLSSIITDKVDVYSFGVVVLEMMCGRKNLDRSQPEEEMHLLRLFERKGEKGQLLDMVDKYNVDMQLHGAEVVELMKIAIWCLQSDYQRRPSMTMVVQVLEGLVTIPDNLEYNFINAPARRTIAATAEDMNAIDDGTPLLASVLSGPR